MVRPHVMSLRFQRVKDRGAVMKVPRSVRTAVVRAKGGFGALTGPHGAEDDAHGGANTSHRAENLRTEGQVLRTE